MASKFLCLIVFVSFGVLSAQSTYNELIYKGNKKFNQKEYDASSEEFVDAVKMNEKNFTGHYNLGNALYKSGKFEEAKEEYKKAQSLAQNKDDKAAALHNLGNAYMKTNDSEKAAQSYKESLKQNPYSDATRKNYEIAKLKEKQQQNSKQNNKSEKDQGKKGDDNQQKNQPQSDPKNQSDKQQGQQQQGEGQQQQGAGKGKDGKQPDPKKPKEQQEGNLPKEVEKAILNRVGSKEQETARRIMNKEGYSVPQSNEKDW